MVVAWSYGLDAADAPDDVCEDRDVDEGEQDHEGSALPLIDSEQERGQESESTWRKQGRPRSGQQQAEGRDDGQANDDAAV